MPEELVGFLLRFGLPGAALLVVGWLLNKAIDKKYELRIGPKQ